MRPNLLVNTRRSGVDARSFLTLRVYHFPFFTKHASDLFRLTTKWLSDSLIADEMGHLETLAGG
jgi:hypothetical protein